MSNFHFKLTRVELSEFGTFARLKYERHLNPEKKGIFHIDIPAEADAVGMFVRDTLARLLDKKEVLAWAPVPLRERTEHGLPDAYYYPKWGNSLMINNHEYRIRSIFDKNGCAVEKAI